MTLHQVVDDAALTARVKTALIKADNVNANAVNVNTYRGEVMLSGFVARPLSAVSTALST